MAMTLTDDTLALQSTEDIVAVRSLVRTRAIECGLGLTDQTKIVTAASELARNTLIYGGGGSAQVESLERQTEQQNRKGVRVTFTDQGPGIENLERALKGGFSTGRGLGLGLSGSKRLCHEFEIETQPGKGTRVTVVRWS